MAKKAAEAADDAVDRGHDAPAEVETDASRVELVTTHNVASGIDDDGNALDHVGTPFDHVIEVHN